MSLAEHDLTVACHDAMADIGQGAAANADGMDLRDIISDSTELRHRAKGIPLEIKVKAGNDDTDAALCQLVAHRHNLIVEELRLVNAQDIAVRAHQEDAGSTLHGCRRDGLAFVADDILFAISHVNRRLEDFHLLLSELGALHSSNEFLGLSREHGTTDDFYASTPHHLAMIVFFVAHFS